MKKIFILLPLLFLLTGCYNYRELNDLAIVSGVSISKDGDKYTVTAEVVNPKKQQDASSGKEPDFVIYKSTGNSMQEAFRKVVKEAPKKLYGAQIDLLIIDEDTAKENLKDILDFFVRDPEIRSEFYVLIGQDRDILEVTTTLENTSSKNILNSLESTNKFMGISSLVTFHDLMNDYLNPNIEIALPSIKETGNEKKGESVKNIEETISDASSVLSNMGIFKDNKFIGYLTEKESIAYNMIMGNTNATLIKTNYKDNQYVINEIIKSDTKVEADVKKQKITISLNGTAAIAESNYDGNLESVKTISKIQKDFNKEIEKLIKNCISNVSVKYNSDIFGFRDLFYKKDPKEYKKLKDNWYNSIFKNLEIEVKSNIKIIEKGNLNGGIYHE